MSGKQRFGVIMMALWSIVLVVMLVWMIVTGDYRLWAWGLAVLCFFALALRTYALEWRRLRDEQQTRR